MDKKELTAKTALEFSIQMWTDIARNMNHISPYMRKQTWIDASHDPEYGQEPINRCYCCEYAHRENHRRRKDICRKCPVKEWRDQAREDGSCTPCLLRGSPYLTYVITRNHDACVAAAEQLVTLFKKNLEELERDEP